MGLSGKVKDIETGLIHINANGICDMSTICGSFMMDTIEVESNEEITCLACAYNAKAVFDSVRKVEINNVIKKHNRRLKP